jgi:hypothetical protein
VKYYATKIFAPFSKVNYNKRLKNLCSILKHFKKEFKMKLKSVIASVLASLIVVPAVSSAANVMMIQVYNNLYNQAVAGGASGMTPSGITAQFFNGATQCDSVVIPFRGFISELIGTGASQKCTTVSSVKIVAGASSVNSSLQIYNVTPVVVSITTSDFEHSIIVQDLGTGVTGTAAADGSIAPTFDPNNGTIATTGTPGYIMKESKLG